MIEFKLLADTKEFSAMESCYKLYTWINDAVLMLLLQILWKMNQLSNYFKETSEEERHTLKSLPPLCPLTKESKYRRHIRSMSDVQASMPYNRVPQKLRKGSHPTLSYDSDTRARRIRQYQLELESSDSSDCGPMKRNNLLERNIVKPTNSMRNIL